MKKRIMAMIFASILAATMVLTGCGSQGETTNGNTETESVSSETSGSEGDSSDVGSQAEEPEAEEETYDVIFEDSNERISLKVIGAEHVHRGDYDYLRLYMIRENLTDKVLNAPINFSAYQDDNQVYLAPHGYDYLSQFGEEDGFVGEESIYDAYDYVGVKSTYFMPGVTKYSIHDWRLSSDSPVTIKPSYSDSSEEYTFDLNDLPGAPEKMKRLETVEDPEKWQDAVVSYSDNGTVNARRVGELGFQIEDVGLIDDPRGESHTGQVIQVTAAVTNNTEKELKAESTIENYSIALVFQDGVNLRNVYDAYYDSDSLTIIQPGESQEVTMRFQPISDSPVFVVFGTALSSYTSQEDKSDNFGMVYALTED